MHPQTREVFPDSQLYQGCIPRFPRGVVVSGSRGNHLRICCSHLMRSPRKHIFVVSGVLHFDYPKEDLNLGK